MADAKIEIAIGELTFSGEGTEEWLERQIDKILKALPPTTAAPPSPARATVKQPTRPPGEFGETLAGYLRAKDATTNQVKRFLATADWLRQRGTATLTTAGVTKALQDNHQSRLSNPAESLNKNVAKGSCEKTADGFFVTPDGLRSLGHDV